MTFRFGARSRRNLEGVHPDLIRVAQHALSISDTDFVIVDGLRTHGEQERLVAAGASTTRDSRHLTGHAIDLAAWVGGVSWDLGHYYRIAMAFRDASATLGIPVRWGGAWVLLTPSTNPADAVEAYVIRCRQQRRKALVDAGHFELPKASYP